MTSWEEWGRRALSPLLWGYCGEGGFEAVAGMGCSVLAGAGGVLWKDEDSVSPVDWP